MARKLRVQFPGAIYHVTMRGVERRAIFTENRERERFLDRLSDGVETHDIRLYLFSLMVNHAHLVLETPRANLDKFMHGLETAYTVYFNRRHDRVGHLVQGRYGATLVQGDRYLLKLTRYVHLNPVCTRQTKKLPLNVRRERLRAYRWSSYRSYIGEDAPLSFMDYGPVLAQTGAKKALRQQEYQHFVEAGLAATDDEFAAVMADRRWGIGDPAFRAWAKEQQENCIAGDEEREETTFRKVASPLTPTCITSVLCQEMQVEESELKQYRQSNVLRPIAAKMLCKYGGLTQTAVAELFGIHSRAAVSAQIKRLKHMLADDEELKTTVNRIERRLQATAARPPGSDVKCQN